MPNILIKERNYPYPGALGEYSNYAVLITGYRVNEASADDSIQPDSNGVYEFTSVGDFDKVIGLAGVEKTIEATGNKEEHYGNRMARELLNLGYPVIYKPIDSIAEMNDEDFWEIFKDKANYDFRFVSHGMLKSNQSVEEKAKYDALKASIKADGEISLVVARFDKLVADVESSDAFKALEADTDKTAEEKAEAKAKLFAQEYLRVIAPSGVTFDGEETDPKYYAGEGEGYQGFKDKAGVLYGSYSAAKAQFGLVNGKRKAIEDVEAAIAVHNELCITSDIFNNINGYITKLARYAEPSPDYTKLPGRGDCIALIELDENEYVQVGSDRPESLIMTGIDKMSASLASDGAYCALTVPSVYYVDGQHFPGAFHYLACFMSALKAGFAEWYAAAGYTRGVSSYVIDRTSVKLGEIAINALEPRSSGDNSPAFACNVIANFRGSYYLWGNRTAHPLDTDLTAKHFLNIRQLCTTLKKQLYVACRRFTFDPNSDTLWFNFVNAITPTLDKMKADQGIRDYKVLKVYEENPKKATLKAKIRIIPIEAVEDFDIEVSLEDSFGGVSVNAN